MHVLMHVLSARWPADAVLPRPSRVLCVCVCVRVCACVCARARMLVWTRLYLACVRACVEQRECVQANRIRVYRVSVGVLVHVRMHTRRHNPKHAQTRDITAKTGVWEFGFRVLRRCHLRDPFEQQMPNQGALDTCGTLPKCTQMYPNHNHPHVWQARSTDTQRGTRTQGIRNKTAHSQEKGTLGRSPPFFSAIEACILNKSATWRPLLPTQDSAAVAASSDTGKATGDPVPVLTPLPAR